ncbi:hypothetical protein Hanom_Chr08g00718391 [Helianthus anomalus]
MAMVVITRFESWVKRVSFGLSFGLFRLTRRFFLRVRRRRREQPEPIASPEPNGDHHRNLSTRYGRISCLYLVFR